MSSFPCITDFVATSGNFLALDLTSGACHELNPAQKVSASGYKSVMHGNELIILFLIRNSSTYLDKNSSDIGLLTPSCLPTTNKLCDVTISALCDVTTKLRERVLIGAVSRLFHVNYHVRFTAF